jgi:hypothetical protein
MRLGKKTQYYSVSDSGLMFEEERRRVNITLILAP